MSLETERSEDGAARIVGALLALPVERRDVPGAPPSTADFEIRAGSGAVPMEVTRSTDGPHRSFWAEVTRSDWRLAGVSASWHIQTGYSYPHVKHLRVQLTEVLKVLEASGIDEFDMDWEDELGNRPDPSAPWARLAVVGVRRGRVVEVDAVEPRIFIGNSGSFVTGPEVVSDLAIAEAANNAVKISEHGHLFVWVDSLDDRSWSAMDLDIPPSERPDFPPNATCWIARRVRSGEWKADRLWVLRPHLPWESLSKRLGHVDT